MFKVPGPKRHGGLFFGARSLKYCALGPWINEYIRTVYVYINVCVCVYIYTDTDTDMSIDIKMCVFIHIYTHIYEYRNTHI